MPPKAGQKRKAEAEAEAEHSSSSEPESPPAPKPKAKGKAPATPTKASPTKPSTPKKPKDVIVYKALAHDAGTAMPVDVTFDRSTEQAKQVKSGGYQSALILKAPSSFTLLKTIMITEGEHKGLQAILLRPAKAFAYIKLPKEVRALICGFYFASKGVVGSAIALDGKRAANKDIFAKTYADGMKRRVGLLGVNKEIHDEAAPILYATTFKFDSTSTLLDFLGMLSPTTRPLLRSLGIKQWVKTSSRTCMHILSECPRLERLHVENGVFAEGDPSKAAKAFEAEAGKFLAAVGSFKGDKEAAVDVLSFGKNAFTFKDEKKNSKPWVDQLVEEFKENLRARLK